MEYAEIQNNEVEALKAIYAADFQPVKVNAVWNQRPSPKFRIQLRPSSEFEDSPIELQVEVTMTPTYPRTLPEVRVCHHNALSGRQLESLKQSIDRTARELKGSEMIFEITSNLQNQIDEYARITSEAAPNLEEDRLRRLQLEERRQNERHDEIQREMEAAALQEEQKYDSLVLEELKRSEEGDSRSDLADDPQDYIVVPESTPGVSTFHHIIVALQRSGGTSSAPVVFRQVQATLKVAQPFFGMSYVAKPLVPTGAASTNNDSDLTVLLTKIEMTSAYWRTPAGVRKLHDLNYQFELVRQFHHPGVVPLYDFSIERFKGAEREWLVSLLTPRSQLTPLSDILDSVGTIGIKTIQSWSFQILEALESLHKAGIRHKCICPYTVMIHHDPDTGESSVLLKHPHYLYLLYKLNEEHVFDSNDGRGEPSWLLGKRAVWTPPEGRSKSNVSDVDVSPSTKWDIWQFGALIVQMVAGKKEMYNFKGDPEAYLRSRGRHWPSTLVSFLTGILHSNPSKRSGALELLTDQFFRTNFGNDAEMADASMSSPSAWHPSLAPTDVATTASLGFDSDSEPNPRGSYGRRKLSNNEEAVFSRYKHDFDEGIVLGRGGFGQVVKARNKLDGRIYAVKKIRATPATLSHILQEVVLLSRLNHQYVVRYYTVWLEDDIGPFERDQEQDSRTGGGVASDQRKNSDSFSDSSRDLSVPPAPAGAMSNEDILDAIPSASLSRFSTHHSLSELDLPSVSQDFMSDSGFIEFGYSDSENYSQAIDDASDDESASRSTPVVGESRRGPYDGSRSRSRPESRPGSLPPSQVTSRVVSRTDLNAKPRNEPFLSRISRLSRKTLYIQMEYCENHTLGDLIHQGLWRNPHEYWRLLRQILEALAYIHGEGVIHRDLKPKNIFIDQARNIKIGDFGLARSVAQPILRSQTSSPMPGSNVNSSSGAGPDEEELTTYVGTSLYAAIEITDSRSRRGYNEKVDMYSLGIIFFEMVWGMSTEMERVQGIRRARLPRMELPAGLVNTKKMEVEVDIIRALLNHNPDKRPSATGLLQSGVIPVEDRDMTVQEALRNVRDQHVVQQLANALFSRPLISAQQVLYDRAVQSSTPSRRQILNNSKFTGQAGLVAAFIEERLKSVFRSHGAVDNTIFRSRVFPRSALYNAPTVVELLDTQGTVLQLAHDLTLPHARRLAEIVPDYTKAYAFDTVYRMDARNPGHHPLKHLEVDFDIIATPGREDLTFDDSETIAVMYDAVSSVFSGLPDRELVVVLGHHDIVSATLNHCGLSQPQYHAALSLLTAERRSSVLARSNVSSASMDMLDQFAFREMLSRAEEKLGRLMPLSEHVRRGMAYIKAVAALVTRLSASAVAPRIFFSPLVHTGTSDFYINGIIFQLVDGGPLSSSGTPRDSPPAVTSSLNSGSVLACGGRYDSLIKLFRNSVLDVRTPLAKAVGFGLSADKLVAIVLQQHAQQSRDQRPIVPPRCQVLVTSFSEPTLKTQGMAVIRTLWGSGITADIARGMLSPDDLVAHAIKEAVPIVVIVKQMHNLSSSNRTFKPLRVKRIGPGATLGHGDADLSFAELVPFVQSELGLSSAGSAVEPPLAELLNMSAASDSGAPDSDVGLSDGGSSRTIILNESGKLKGGRKNRWQLEEKSTEAKATFLSELNNAPLVSLDLRDDVIEAITTVSPHAVEEWKRRVVGLSPNQKAYIMSVQAKLANEAVKSPHMLLFSSKTEHVFVYRYE